MTRLLTGGWRRWRTGALVVTVVALDLLLFSTLLNTGTAPAARAGLVLGYAVAGGALLSWQRRAVLPGYAALWAHALGSVVVTGYRPTLPLLVGLYAVAASTTRRAVALGALAATLGPIGLAVADGVHEAPPGEGLATFTGLSTLLVIVHCGVFAVGRWARRVRERAGALERAREAAAQDAVEVERARIAGELHDIVGHSVTVMTLQAAGARKVMRHDPNRADEALAQVGGAGAQAMNELRRLLTDLRPQPCPEPGAGAHRIDELVDRIRATGVTVALTGDDSPGQRDLAGYALAYRVVQEALTNVVRHAGPGSHATVALDWHPDALTVEVVDDGRGQPIDEARGLSTGHGLAGLAVRVDGLGGRLESGPVAGGGFRVWVSLPLAGPAALPAVLPVTGPLVRPTASPAEERSSVARAAG